VESTYTAIHYELSLLGLLNEFYFELPKPDWKNACEYLLHNQARWLGTTWCKNIAKKKQLFEFGAPTLETTDGSAMSLAERNVT